MHQGNYATIPNYLERELRYMDAGERGPKRQRWATRGYRVTNSHVIHHNFGHRYAQPALGGADLRRPRHHRAGCGRIDRKPYVSRLWTGLGRLHPCRICRSPAAHVWFRFHGYRRAVVRQSLHVWRRLRHGRRVGGPLAGLAAVLLLALCPTYYGHMFMNPKDAPFAVAMVILMLGLVRLAEEYPSPSPRTILIVGLGAGLSIGSRVLGGLALVYAVVGFLPLFLEEIHTHSAREAAHRFIHVVYVLLPGLVLGYLVMGLIWPWSIMEPDNPFHALSYFSHFFEKPWKEMFDGALVSVPDMPWSYLPTLFALQLPEVLLGLSIAGVVGTFMSLSRSDVSARRKTILLMLTLAATLPLVIAMVKRPALYNGIRHFIFVIPPMTVLAGVTFAWGMNWLKSNKRSWQPAVLAVFAFGLLLPLGEMIRLHPYQYTHFNHIAGTVRSADNLFMLDYWGLALKQASDGLRDELVERQEVPPKGRKWKVAVCGPQRPAQVALGSDFTIGWDSNAADFAMTLGEFYCKGLTAPVMVEIKRDDVVFARVYDIRGRSISSLLAIPAP